MKLWWSGFFAGVGTGIAVSSLGPHFLFLAGPAFMVAYMVTTWPTKEDREWRRQERLRKRKDAI